MISSWFELTRQQRLEGSTLPTGGSGLSLRFDDLNSVGEPYITPRIFGNWLWPLPVVVCASVCTFWVGGGEGRKVERLPPDENRSQPGGASETVTADGGAMDLAARGKTQPEVAQASRDDEADPAHPYRCSPATDHDWPTHVNPQEMEERHHRENYAGQHIKCSLIHGPILQEFHHNKQ
jgi:hypothetical protein